MLYVLLVLSCNFHDEQMDRDREREREREREEGNRRGYRNLKRDHVCRPNFQGGGGRAISLKFPVFFPLSIFKAILMTKRSTTKTTNLQHIDCHTKPHLLLSKKFFAARCTKTDDDYKAQTCVNIYIRRPA